MGPNYSKNLTFLSFVLFLFTLSAQQPGSIDNSFQVGTGADAIVTAIDVQANGHVIIAGGFNTYKGVSKRKIARIKPNGSVDNTFNPGTGFTGQDSVILAIKLQNDTSILVGGSFSSYQGIPANNIIRLKPNGERDTSFQSGIGADERVIDIILQTDGKIILGGYFNNYNGVPSNGIIRLNPDGTVDTSFHIGSGAGQGLHVGVHQMDLQSDGKIVIAGRFDNYNLTPRNYIARLNADGTIDPLFNPGVNIVGGSVSSCTVQPNGKILIGGAFHHFSTTLASGITRLNENGSLDTSFHSGYGVGAGSLPYHNVDDILLQDDGKIIIIGYFMTYDGVLRNNLSRLNPDGTADLTFNVGSGTNSYINSAFLQEDGKLLIGGQFTAYNGQARSCILRLNGGTDFAAINDIENDHLSIYPNPASTTFQTTPVSPNSTLQILDLNGKVLSEHSDSGLIDVRSLSDGIYMVVVYDKGIRRSSHKLIIRK